MHVYFSPNAHSTMAFGVRHESLGVLLAPYCSSQDLELAAFPWGALSQLSGAQPSGLV